MSTADFITRTRDLAGEDQCTIRARSRVPEESLCAYMAPDACGPVGAVGQRGMKPSCLVLTFK